MGWLGDTVERWANSLPVRMVSAPIKFCYNTSYYLYQQLHLLPSTWRALSSNKRANQSIQQMAYIASHDLIPLIIINAGYALIESYLNPSKESAEEGMNSQLLIASVSTLTSMALKLINLRLGTRMTTRMMLVSLKATDDFNKITPRDKSNTCIQNNCGWMDKAKGSGREFIEFAANDLAISGLGKATGLIGLSTMLSIYARGRYIAKTTMPERCPNHRDLQTEYALALGLSHQGINVLVNLLLENTIGLPPAFCMRIIEQMMMLLHIALAAEMTPPYTAPGEQTFVYDPMEKFEDAVGWTSRVIVSGLKKQVPELLKQPGTSIDWRALFLKAKKIYYHPLTEKTKKILLPELLQSTEDFVKDPVVKQDWPSVQKGLDNSLSFIIKFKYENRTYYRVAKWFPKPTAFALNMALGVPVNASEFAIHFFGDEGVREQLTFLRNWIRSLKLDDAEDSQGAALPPLRVVPVDDAKVLENIYKETELSNDADEALMFENNDRETSSPAANSDDELFKQDAQDDRDSDDALFESAIADISQEELESDDEFFAKSSNL
jgi:hypothetical protein